MKLRNGKNTGTEYYANMRIRSIYLVVWDTESQHLLELGLWNALLSNLTFLLWTSTSFCDNVIHVASNCANAKRIFPILKLCTERVSKLGHHQLKSWLIAHRHFDVKPISEPMLIIVNWTSVNQFSEIPIIAQRFNKMDLRPLRAATSSKFAFIIQI